MAVRLLRSLSGTVVYRKRISLTDLESDHFSGQLVERVAWAVRDARVIEHKDSRAAPSLAVAGVPAAA
jgi:hypothetical protein